MGIENKNDLSELVKLLRHSPAKAYESVAADAIELLQVQSDALRAELQKEKSKTSEVLFFCSSDTRLHFFNKWSEEYQASVPSIPMPKQEPAGEVTENLIKDAACKFVAYWDHYVSSGDISEAFDSWIVTDEAKCLQRATASPRITEQDAREICESFVDYFANKAMAANYFRGWFVQEGMALLKKLNENSKKIG